ncbi:MAG: class I SAM-dependent methyltransferase [Isosphaeraceae bacterium]|nr:class I SAM-dependent methyltransferase [Isosphaeraceae bacterium]
MSDQPAAAPTSHDERLSRAFDGQAARFEKAPIQSNPELLARLVGFAAFEPGSLILDAGCGPGLVAEALASAGLRVFGVDLSPEMIERAAKRCPSGRFAVGSILDPLVADAGPFDGAISRLVLHHVTGPRPFLQRQVDLVRPGGWVVLCDHTTGTDPARRHWHQEIERDRDRTHTNCLTPGEIVDLFADADLRDLSMLEYGYELDFDEWFDRGTPRASKDIVRANLLDGSWIRGFDPIEREDGGITIRLQMCLVRGRKPA